jgi:hypothetical protein
MVLTLLLAGRRWGVVMRLVPPFNPIYCCVLCTNVNKMMMGLDSWSGAEGAVLQASVARLVENHINSRSLGLESWTGLVVVKACILIPCKLAHCVSQTRETFPSRRPVGRDTCDLLEPPSSLARVFFPQHNLQAKHTRGYCRRWAPACGILWYFSKMPG